MTLLTKFTELTEFTELNVLTVLTVIIVLTVLTVYRAATSIDNYNLLSRTVFFLSKKGVNPIFFDTFLGIIIGHFFEITLFG